LDDALDGVVWILLVVRRCLESCCEYGSFQQESLIVGVEDDEDDDDEDNEEDDEDEDEDP